MNSLQHDRTRAEHVRALDRQCRPRSNFDKALLAYLALRPRSGADGLRDGRRAAMLHALDNLATWPQVRRWRRNKSPAPQWARDLLARKLRERRAEIDMALF